MLDCFGRWPPGGARARPREADLHDSEINGGINWFYDGMWSVKVNFGDTLNGYDAEKYGSAAAEWLRANRSSYRKAPSSSGIERASSSGQRCRFPRARPACGSRGFGG